MKTQLLFEQSVKGRRGYRFPDSDISRNDSAASAGTGGEAVSEIVPDHLARRRELGLPELSEHEVIRHYAHLGRRNFGVDFGFYPLGSCTMKYNPKVNERAAAEPKLTQIHPLQPAETMQGTLELMHQLLAYLCELTGMKQGTLQPLAGAHGEFTGMKLIKAYFSDRGETRRTKVLIPTSAHGTNPASAHLAGFQVVEIPADERGLITLESIRPHLNDELAGIMLTNPNTLGLYEQEILEIAEAVHQAGGLLYYDGANMNAVMGISRPGDMGFDVLHLNLHKTFSTPHGGGGPGSGPVLVQDKLAEYLPLPGIARSETGEGPVFSWDWNLPKSIGKVSGFYGNIGVAVRALAYLLVMGRDGLQRASELAVLNANYLKVRLSEHYRIPYSAVCKHEFVLSTKNIKDDAGISAIDIAKALIDAGIHPPTIYFPLIVPEAMMIEPTETETKETLDRFIDVMQQIHEQAYADPDQLHRAPERTAVGRADEVAAARHPKVRWTPPENGNE